MTIERVILVGLSGTGKSAVAFKLASRLGFEPVDVDDNIVGFFGLSIPEVFDRYGESVFRTVERQQLASACSAFGRVVATGGGAVCDPRNWLTMRPNSLIVHLHAESDEILQRLQRQTTSDPTARRPLLESSDPRSALERLWLERRALYQQSDVTIVTSGKDGRRRRLRNRVVRSKRGRRLAASPDREYWRSGRAIRPLCRVGRAQPPWQSFTTAIRRRSYCVGHHRRKCRSSLVRSSANSFDLG